MSQAKNVTNRSEWTFITICWIDYDTNGHEVNAVCYYKTHCLNREDIDRWVCGWAESWENSTIDEIDTKDFEYFDPYQGEVNESTWQ
jgi:hypothetical protein